MKWPPFEESATLEAAWQREYQFALARSLAAFHRTIHDIPPWWLKGLRQARAVRTIKMRLQ